MLHQAQQAEFVTRSRCINCGSEKLVELSRGNYVDQPLAGFLAADPWGEDPIPHLQEAAWILSKCSDCNQVFHSRILDPEWNERRFSQWMSADAIKQFESRLGPPFARNFDAATHYVEHALRIERLTRNIRSPDEAVRLLDFGCGFGGFMEVCGDFGFDVCGVDRSIGRRAEAKVRIVPSLQELADQTPFHVLTLFEVLEHLDHPAQMLAELSGYLVEDGLLILETPDCTGVTGIRTHRDYLLVHPLEHINAFTHETLASIAGRSGFMPLVRGPAFVTSETSRAVKRMAKHALRRDGLSTQIYFRKR